MEQIEILARDFFLQRFGNLPEADPAYFGEWLDRFRTGNPSKWMDSKSLEVYKRIMNL